MPPIVIGICGAGSGSGKTTMAEELLGRALGSGLLNEDSPWGAIKFTKTGLYTSVITDTNILLEEGKDTARMLRAGARRAIWVMSPGGAGLEEALSMAMGEMYPCRAVIVEGNSAVELLKPDIVIFMSGPSFKGGAETALRSADIVYRPEGAVLPAAPGKNVFKEGAVFCGDLVSCAGEVLKKTYFYWRE